MTLKKRLFAVLCGSLLAVAPVLAHHSIASEYNFDKPVTVKGVLQRMEFINPHSIFRVEVKQKNGTSTMWIFQTGGAGGLRRHKLFAGSALIGQTLTFTGFAAKNGRPQAFVESIGMPDGKVVTMWFGDPNGR